MSRSRSRSPMRPNDGGENWNEELWKFFTEEVQVVADDKVIEETIRVLEEKGEVSHSWELLAAPPEMFMEIFPMDTHKKHLMLVRHAVKVHGMKSKMSDPVAMAVQALAKEQKAARKKRHNRGEESSSEPETHNGKEFDLHANLQKYGLAGVPCTHTQKTKNIAEFAKKAQNAVQKNRESIWHPGVCQTSFRNG